MACIFFYPGVFLLSFGIYVFQRDASRVDVLRGHISPLNQSLAEKKKQLSDKDTAFHSSHQGLIILEWQALDTFPRDELSVILFIYFPLRVSAFSSQ